MAYDKIIKIIDLIREKTEKGMVRWSETANSDTFEASFPNYSVTISARPGQVGVDFYISIFNSDGRLLEEWSDVELSTAAPGSLESLSSLYDAARGIALGIDDALNHLLVELGDIPF